MIVQLIQGLLAVYWQCGAVVSWSTRCCGVVTMLCVVCPGSAAACTTETARATRSELQLSRLADCVRVECGIGERLLTFAPALTEHHPPVSGTLWMSFAQLLKAGDQAPTPIYDPPHLACIIIVKVSYAHTQAAVV